jgi:hypothetical protein
MISPQPLTQAQLDQLQTYVSTGDRVSYWQTLGGWGFDYAKLALGVVLNDTVNGRIANEFAENKAAEVGVLMDAEDWAEVGQAIMQADFSARVDLFQQSPETADLSVSDIRTYHTAVFGSFGLPAETWTVYAPTIVLGPGAEDALWARVLASQESMVQNFAFGTDMFLQMVSVASDSSNAHQALAAAWVDDILFDGVFTAAVSGPEPGPYQVVAENGGLVIGGTLGDDNLSGSDKGDVLIGYDGNDKLTGLAGDDVLFGGAENDTLVGGAGNDILYGGDRLASVGTQDGIDTADYSSAAASIVIDLSLSSNQASNDGDGGSDTLISIERIVGSQYNDSIRGSDSFGATTGNDSLLGGGGGDSLDGGSGNDVLIGGLGFDILVGGDNNDLLDSSGDVREADPEDPESIHWTSDELYGGTGNDTFITSGNDTVYDPENGDVLFLGDLQLTGGTWQHIGDELIGYDGDTPITNEWWGYVGEQGEIYEHYSDGDISELAVHIYDRTGEYVNDWTGIDDVYVHNWDPGELGIQLAGGPPPEAPLMSPNEGLLAMVAWSTTFGARDDEQAASASGAASRSAVGLTALSSPDILAPDDRIFASDEAHSGVASPANSIAANVVVSIQPADAVSTSAEQVALMAA